MGNADSNQSNAAGRSEVDTVTLIKLFVAVVAVVVAARFAIAKLGMPKNWHRGLEPLILHLSHNG